MKKNLLYFLLLIPLFFLSYYFFFTKSSISPLNFKPNLRDLEDTKEKLYSKENLYDYLNGGAEKIISFGLLYLKVWEGKIKEKDIKLELYYFEKREGVKDFFNFLTKEKNKNFEIIEDQGIAYGGNFLYKVNSYPPDLNLIDKKIKEFLEWCYERKI